MDPGSKDLPPPCEDEHYKSSKGVTEPDVLVLAGQFVVSDTAAATPLYHMSWSVTSIPQKGSSVVFERVEHDFPKEAQSSVTSEQRNRHIFYLAHPAGVQYQTDIPAFYITSVSPDMPGNISFETSKSRFQKTEFRALLSANRGASDTPLFDEHAQPLFDIKPKWVGGHYIWSDSNGRHVAYEDRKGEQHKLVVTESMDRVMRDTLVATWCLRLWHHTAESRQAKRDAMERMTPPEAVLQGHGSTQMAKRMGALGSLAGAGA
ncbi:hypothetical protein F5X99DRAFT_410076 [Biscogniauxia marginata]|nr:hypothetical protein F5X99DRAFT_410076 [Biscogniauxia marginata]